METFAVVVLAVALLLLWWLRDDEVERNPWEDDYGF